MKYLECKKRICFLFQPLQEKLMKFVDRFRATASMVTTSGRWSLLPIVNHTPYMLPAVWRLEPNTLKLPLKKQLPYCKVCVFKM